MKNKLLAAMIGVMVILLLLEGGLRVVGAFSSGATDRRPPQDLDTYTIVCLGDSWTYGIGAAYDKSYPRQLEDLLKALPDKKKIRVINRGVGAYNSSQILHEYKELLRSGVRPDLVIVLSGGANYWNYWGLYDALKDTSFISAATKCLYRIRVFKLTKLLFLTIKEKNRDMIHARLASYNVDPSPEAGNMPQKQDYCTEGWRHVDRNEYDKAVILFKKGLHIDPRESACYLGLGRIYYNQKIPYTAAAWYFKGLAANPHESEFYACMGELYAGQRQYDKAVTWYAKGIAINPNNVRLYLDLGMLFRERERYDDAIAWFQKGINVNPKDSNLYIGLGCCVYFGKKDYEKAKFYIKKGLSLSQERLSLFPVFCSALTNEERADLYKELVKDGLMPQWFIQNSDYLVLDPARNDEKRNKRIEEWITHDVEKIISLSKARGSKVLLLSYPNHYMHLISLLMRQIANKNSVYFMDFERVFSDLLLKGGKPEDYFVPDNHCNAVGYGIMARNIVDKIGQEHIFDRK